MWSIILSFTPEAVHWLVKVGENLVGGVAQRLFCGFTTAHTDSCSLTEDVGLDGLETWTYKDASMGRSRGVTDSAAGSLVNAPGLQFSVSSVLIFSHTDMFPFCPGNVAFSSYNK